MKLNLYILYICFLTLPCFAQLLPGDIAIVSYNADGVEEFSFVATVDIPGGEVLKFTDNGWLNTGSFRGGEGTITWTAPPTGVPCGTIVRFNDNVADAGQSSGSMALAGSGDQILVYQGSSAAPSFVYALNNEGSRVWQANATDTRTSSLPTGLLEGFSAFALQEVDNIAYDGTLTSASRALILDAISDFHNWTGGTNSTPPSPLSYTAAPFSITDCASTATIGFDAATSTDTEGNTLLIPISLSNATVFPVSVQINATLLTAELGDFIYTTTLTFNTNTTQNLSVSLVQDADADDETFELTLIETTATGVTIGNGSQTTTIVDDEIIPAPAAGIVFITEVSDASNSSNEYIEFYNNSNESVSVSTSKLVMLNSGGTVETIWDFNDDIGTASIPARGFLIVTRGGEQVDFEVVHGALDANTVFIQGTSDMFFGTGTSRRWKLYDGGTVSNADGTLIDDTETGVGGSNRHYQNIFTDTYVSDTPANATPGALEYLVYNGGAWVNTTAMDGTTAAKDAYLYDDYTVSANAAANDIGIASTNTLTVSATSGLNLAGDLTVSGSLSITAGGSLIVSGTSSGNITYNINVADTDWHLISSPVAGESFNDAWANSNSIADGSGTNRGISTYQNGTLDTDTDGGGADTETGSWVYMLDGESGTFGSGTGYSLKRTSSGTYSFTGTYPTTSVTPAITQDVTNWNLIGNPYPSYINIETFLSTNSAKLDGSFQSIYVWNASEDKYDDLATGFVYPGQAFFLNAASTPETVSFTEAMQSHQTGVTFYKTENTTVIDLNLTNGENTKSTQINYLENKTTGLDPRFDIGMFDGVASDIRIYTQLISNNEGISFRRQALPNSDYENMVIPVGVKAAVGKEITFSTDAVNLPADIKVFLEDRLTNTFTRLDEAHSEYKITLTETLNGVGRFYMHTTARVLSTEDVILNSVRIYKTDASTLKITGLPQGKTSFYLYNILGKEMMTTIFTSNGNKEISLSKLASGIYLAKMQTEKGAISKKIILE